MNFSLHTILDFVARPWRHVLGAAGYVASIHAPERWLQGRGRVAFFGYPKYYPLGDQSHDYMGAEYFREMAYGDLYNCSAIARDELGTVSSEDERKSRFSPERWEKYKADVRLFQTASDKGYWEDRQKDHGFNPPPVWTILGRGFGERRGATAGYLELGAAAIALRFGQIFTILLAPLPWYRPRLDLGVRPPQGSLSRPFGPRSGDAVAVTGAARKRAIAEGDEE